MTQFAGSVFIQQNFCHTFCVDLAARKKKTTLSQLTAPITMYPQVLKNVVVTDKDETLNHPAVQQAVRDEEARLGDSGRILLRKSGTEPLLRVMAEAESVADCEKSVDAIIDAMRQQGMLVRIK